MFPAVASRSFTLLAAVITAAVLASAASATRAGAVTCTGSLTAKLTQGPDSGLTLQGPYSLKLLPSGTFSGTLADASGKVAMTGQARGHQVNWIFTLSGGRHLYVTGTALDPLTTCTSHTPEFWGVATGPRFGDLGVWAGVRPQSR
jgi:hypothetical protein